MVNHPAMSKGFRVRTLAPTGNVMVHWPSFSSSKKGSRDENGLMTVHHLHPVLAETFERLGFPVPGQDHGFELGHQPVDDGKDLGSPGNRQRPIDEVVLDVDDDQSPAHPHLLPAMSPPRS